MNSPYYGRYPNHFQIQQVMPNYPYYQPPNVYHMQQHFSPNWINHPMNASIPVNPHGMQGLNQLPAQPGPINQYNQTGFQTQQGNQFNQHASWLEVFKTEKGQFDVNKVMSTAGQMMSTAQQFGSLVKGIGSIFPKV